MLLESPLDQVPSLLLMRLKTLCRNGDPVLEVEENRALKVKKHFLYDWQVVVTAVVERRRREQHHHV